jgi:GNAT superfamily N-acetyltransferase
VTAVRRARASDAPALAALHERAVFAAYSPYVPAEKMAERMTPAQREEHWRERAERDDPLTLVLDDVSGFVTSGSTRDDDTGGDGELYAIYVEPSLIGRGSGRVLLAAAEDHLRSRFAAATLWVFERNTVARAFYERHGWEVDARPFDRHRWAWNPSVRYRKCW